VTQRLSWVAIAQAGNLQVGRYHTPFESSLSELGVSMRLPPPVFEATPAGKMLGLLQILSEHGLRPTERTTNAKALSEQLCAASDWRGEAKFEALVRLRLRPLRQRGRASLFVNFAGDEMTLLIEMAVDLSVN
jgi:hypothetical protein